MKKSNMIFFYKIRTLCVYKEKNKIKIKNINEKKYKKNKFLS